jgi:RNA-directed DNA polymerase
VAIIETAALYAQTSVTDLMIKKPLQTLFQAMYHGKYDYRDFIDGDISIRYKREQIRDNNKKRARNIIIPDKTLKAYHGFLNLFILDYFEINDRVVFSYRKRVNAGSAVTLHAQSKHFYQADIRNFFPSIDLKLVRRVLDASKDSCPVSDVEENLERILELVTVEGSLPLGFPTSPAISNAVLLPFDNEFEQHCARNNLIYTRYSDDIIVSARERESILGLESIMGKILDEVGLGQLNLHAGKAKITSVGRKIKLLGLVILPNGTVSVDAKLKNYVETLLHLYIKDKLALGEFMQLDITKSLEKLSGYLNYINTVDQYYLDKLRRKYGVTAIDTLIHQSKK